MALARTKLLTNLSHGLLKRFPPLCLVRPLSSPVSSPTPNLYIRSFATCQGEPPLLPPPPKKVIKNPPVIDLPGFDFEHWLVVVFRPPSDASRDDIIDYYIKTLAKAIGSEEELRMKMYSVSTKYDYAFGAHVCEEFIPKLKALEDVTFVLPDHYEDVENKTYGGEPFINGEAVPYDPKYHEKWVREYNRRSKPCVSCALRKARLATREGTEASGPAKQLESIR